MRVAILGQGYVGSAIASAAKKAGHEVIGIETDLTRAQSLSNVGYPVSSDYSKISESEVIILAVPTPLTESREPDLSFIKSACSSLKPYAKTDALIINESTSFPGTLRNVIAPILGDSFLYASAPERVDPANPEWNVENTPRLIGGLTQEATNKAEEFYKSISNQVISVSTPEVAEAAKLFENTFRQVNIALVNEFAQIANALGIPTYETLAAAETKPYGFMKFLPSIGVGGHCIPVDPSYLSYKAKEAGLDAKFINLANQVNLKMPEYVASRIEKEHGIKEKNIQIAGIAYKPNVSDTRESPALSLIEILRTKGAKVSWHDPYVKKYSSELSTPIQKVDIGIICTAHDGVSYAPWTENQTLVIDVSTSSNLGWPKYL
jgi:UDP-N-acetyl-D-glucosamine dehydrogenase